MIEQKFPAYKKIDLEKLIPYARNSRTHSDEQVDKIAASIKEFGFMNPVIVDGDNGIIAGHGRVLAAKKLGLNSVPAIEASHLSEAQRRAYIIADNRLALDAGWDEEMLRVEFADLQEMGFDIELTGFTLDEVDAMTIEELPDGLTDEDDVPDVPEQPVSALGDVWLLGNHRLMCGDSTSIDAVEKLMDGEKAQLIFTDPPYNVAFNGRSGKHDVIKNDNLPDAEFERFISDVCGVISLVKPEAYYVWCNWDFYGVLQGKLKYKSCIVWAKNVFGLGNGYRHQHEFCLFNGKIDEVVKNESDLWEVKKDSRYVHPTQKPVALSVRAFGNHIKLTRVLDLFGGSGSTLIGAEQTGRKAYLMELDPKYCDVIIKRWQDFTGKEAVHEESGATFAELCEQRLD